MKTLRILALCAVYAVPFGLRKSAVSTLAIASGTTAFLPSLPHNSVNSHTHLLKVPLTSTSLRMGAQSAEGNINSDRMVDRYLKKNSRGGTITTQEQLGIEDSSNR
jgi:hypothetical protein